MIVQNLQNGARPYVLSDKKTGYTISMKLL